MSGKEESGMKKKWPSLSRGFLYIGIITMYIRPSIHSHCGVLAMDLAGLRKNQNPTL